MKFKAENQIQLLQLVQNQVGYTSVSRARKLIKSGNVKVDGEVVTIPSTDVKPEQEVEVTLKRSIKSDLRPKDNDFPFQIVHDDEHLIAFIKPAGLAMISENPKLSSVHRTLMNYVRNSDEVDELHVVNRIDKKESGIIVCARDLKSKKELDSQDLQFRYYAVIQGSLKNEDGRLIRFFRRNRIGLLNPVSEDTGGQESEIQFRTMNVGNVYSLLKLTSRTYVKNQERAHLANVKHPVIGDKRYKSTVNPIGRLGLHLFSVGFAHPSTGESVEIKTPVPREFLRLVKHSKA